MLSIKKHIDNLSAMETVAQAQRELIVRLVEALGKRIPSPNDSARREFDEQIEAWLEEFRLMRGAQGISGLGGRLEEFISRQWNALSRHFLDREKGLTDIISLLAETAGRLDISHQEFYRNLDRSVHAVEAVGAIRDFDTLKTRLAERISGLKATVDEGKAATQESIAGLRSGIEQAREQAIVIGKLVSSAALPSLPTRRHAEQFISDLIMDKRPFVLAVVCVNGWAAIERRYGREGSQAAMDAFVDRLRARVPMTGHLYEWSRGAYLAVIERTTRDAIEQMMSQFLNDLKANPVALEESRGKPGATLEPNFVVHGVEPEESRDRVTGFVDRFVKSPA